MKNKSNNLRDRLEKAFNKNKNKTEKQNKNKTESIDNKKVMEFQVKYSPFGYADISRALEIIEESKIESGYSPDILEEWVDDISDGRDLDKIDIVAIVMDKVFYHVQEELQHLNIDPEDYDIYVYANSTASIYMGQIDNFLAELNQKVNSYGGFSKATRWFLKIIEIINLYKF